MIGFARLLGGAYIGSGASDGVPAQLDSGRERVVRRLAAARGGRDVQRDRPGGAEIAVDRDPVFDARRRLEHHPALQHSARIVVGRYQRERIHSRAGVDPEQRVEAAAEAVDDRLARCRRGPPPPHRSAARAAVIGLARLLARADVRAAGRERAAAERGCSAEAVASAAALHGERDSPGRRVEAHAARIDPGAQGRGGGVNAERYLRALARGEDSRSRGRGEPRGHAGHAPRARARAHVGQGIDGGRRRERAARRAGSGEARIRRDGDVPRLDDVLPECPVEDDLAGSARDAVDGDIVGLPLHGRERDPAARGPGCIVVGRDLHQVRHAVAGVRGEHGIEAAAERIEAHRPGRRRSPAPPHRAPAGLPRMIGLARFLGGADVRPARVAARLGERDGVLKLVVCGCLLDRECQRAARAADAVRRVVKVHG